MATGGVRLLYEEDDKLDEYLLNQVSKWVLYHRLPSLARDLGISQAQFSRIVGAHSQPEEQIFQVLYKWHNRQVLSVKDLMSEMVTWQGQRYLDPGVWNQIQSKINPETLPSNITTLQLPPPPRTAASPLEIMYMNSLTSSEWQEETTAGETAENTSPQITEVEDDHVRDESVSGTTSCVVEEPVHEESSDVPTRPDTNKPELSHRVELESNDNQINSLNKDLKFIRKIVKKKLHRRCKNALSTDWLPDEKAKTFPLREYYSDLRWNKKVKKAMRDTTFGMKRIHDIFNNDYADGGINVAIIGRAGTGKSSSMAMLALDWVNENDDSDSTENKLHQFDLVFLVELCNVTDNSSLEQIIIKQHGLKEKKIAESQIRSILEGESGSKVLLLLDGYDEYRKGTNDDIDTAKEDTIGDCFLILTSRDGDYISKETLDKMDGEIELRGFTEKSMEECAIKYLESKDLADKLIKEAKLLGIDKLLRIPIILLMVCVLFFKEHTLPRSQTTIISKILELCIDRSALKHFGKRFKDIPWLEDKLFCLGELAWKTLKRSTGQLLLPKNDVLKISEDLLKLGILQDPLFEEEASLYDQPQWLVFPHKLFQEYWAAYYASTRITQGAFQEEVDQIFNMENDIEQHWNVIKFTCGLLENSTLFIERTCSCIRDVIARKSEIDSFIEYRNTIDLKHFLCLDDLNRERSKISVSPFCNNVVCCLNSESTALYPNRSLYFISGLDRECTVVEGAPLPSGLTNMETCVIIVTLGLESPVSVALEACSKIRQPIEYLEIRGPGRSIPRQNLHPSKKWHLTFSKRTALSFTFFYDLLAIQDSIHICTGISTMKIVHCFIPDHFFDKLNRNTEMARLTVMNVSVEQESSDAFKKTLCKQLKYLTKLESLQLRLELQNSLSVAIESDTFSRLTCLRRLSVSDCCLSCDMLTKLMKQLTNGPLEVLDVSNNLLRGSIDSLSMFLDIKYPHLRELKIVLWKFSHYLCSELDRADVLGLSYLIKKDSFPRLEHLDIRNNDLVKEQSALEKLLKACERIGTGRQCKVQVYEEEVSDCLRRKHYKCLKEYIYRIH